MIIFFVAKDGEALYCQLKQDQELTVAQIVAQIIAKFRLHMKKVRKNTRPFRYDLNQIPYNYTVEVRNRFNGLDLIDRVPDELWNVKQALIFQTKASILPTKSTFLFAPHMGYQCHH